jgi:hypothetical protein
MLKYLLFTGLLFALHTKAQDTSYDTLFTDAVLNRSDTNVFFYIDSSITFYGNFSRFSRKGRVEGFVDQKGTSTFMLFTKSELKEIDRQIDNQVLQLWPSTFLPGCKRLSNDSILTFLQYMAEPGFQKERKYRWYYLFSQPVFIRNKRVAIFRIAEMAGPSAGNDLIFIYTKELNDWKYKMIIFAGAW